MQYITRYIDTNGNENVHRTVESRINCSLGFRSNATVAKGFDRLNVRAPIVEAATETNSRDIIFV